MKKNFKRILITLSGVFVVLLAATILYLSLNQYKPTDEVLSNLDKYEKNISITKDYLFFDSVSEDTAIIIYPGAKVDSKAYGNIAIELMNNDIDVFILKYPFNFALLNITKADEVLKKYDYQNIYLAGHSLGGVCAGMHINKHQNEFKGLILFASYSSAKLPENLKVIVFNGTNDQVMNSDSYQKNITNLPDDYKEVIIEGGNHGQFGSYGFQKGDGMAAISEDEQRNIIVKNIIDYLNNN